MGLSLLCHPRASARLRTALVSLGATVLVNLSFGQTTTADGDIVRKLTERLDKQEAEIAALKARLGETASEAVAAENETYPKLNFHGFGDVTYHASNSSEAKDSFVIGQFDFFVTSELSPKVGVLVETVLEANENNTFGSEMERILLQLHPNPLVNIDIGRYHSNIGYYNTAYHHGTWFQTAVGRPDFLDFEDGSGLIPTHNVGVSVSGVLPSGSLGLHYVAEIGNGRPYWNPSRAEKNPVLNVNDTNHDKSYNLALYSKPDAYPGLQVGGNIYLDHLSPDGLRPTVETIFSGYVSYRLHGWEYLAEGHRIEHAVSGGRTTASHAVLAQFSRKIGDLTPYLRYQYKAVPHNDEVFEMINAAGTVHGPTVGLRYDFSDYAAFKAEFQHLIDKENEDINEAIFQACFTF